MNIQDSPLETNALRLFDESYRKNLYLILDIVGMPFTQIEKENIPLAVNTKKEFLLSKIGTWWKREGAILYKNIMSLNVIDDDEKLVEKLREHLKTFLKIICETVESHIVALILDDETLEKLENPWSLK